MNEKIKNREVEKFYLAAVHGELKPKSGRLEGFLFKDAKKNQVFVSNKSVVGSKTAVTEYKTLQVKDGLSLVQWPAYHRPHASDPGAAGACGPSAFRRRQIRQRTAKPRL